MTHTLELASHNGVVTLPREYRHISLVRVTIDVTRTKKKSSSYRDFWGKSEKILRDTDKADLLSLRNEKYG